LSFLSRPQPVTLHLFKKNIKPRVSINKEQALKKKERWIANQTPHPTQCQKCQLPPHLPEPRVSSHSSHLQHPFSRAPKPSSSLTPPRSSLRLLLLKEMTTVFLTRRSLPKRSSGGAPNRTSSSPTPLKSGVKRIGKLLLLKFRTVLIHSVFTVGRKFLTQKLKKVCGNQRRIGYS